MLRVYFSGVKSVHNVVDPSPPSMSRNVSLFQIEALCPLNINFPLPPPQLLATSTLYLYSIIYLFWVPHVNGIIQYWSFSH